MMSGEDMIMLVELMNSFEEYLNLKTNDVDQKKVEEKAKKMNGIIKEFEEELKRLYVQVRKNFSNELGDFSKEEIKAFIELVTSKEEYKSLHVFLDAFSG